MIVFVAMVMTGPDCVKGMGEPPTSMGCGPLLALRQAMESAVQDLTGTSSFITVGELLPLLPLSLLVSCSPSSIIAVGELFPLPSSLLLSCSIFLLHHCW